QRRIQGSLCRATDAPPRDFHDARRVVADQLPIDTDLARLVDDDDGLLAGKILEPPLQQGRLARAEKPRDHGDWNRCVHREILAARTCGRPPLRRRLSPRSVPPLGPPGSPCFTARCWT